MPDINETVTATGVAATVTQEDDDTLSIKLDDPSQENVDTILGALSNAGIADDDIEVEDDTITVTLTDDGETVNDT